MNDLERSSLVHRHADYARALVVAWCFVGCAALLVWGMLR